MEEKKERYIVAVDMDGTLLNSQGQVTKRTADVLQRLLDEGHYVIPASGRSLGLLPSDVTALKGIPYGVLENGAVVWDWKNSCVLKRFPMPEGAAERILASAETYVKAEEEEILYFVEFFAEGQVYADKADLERFLDMDILGNFADYMLYGHTYLENFMEQKDLLNQAEKLNLFFAVPKHGAAVRKIWDNDLEVSVTSSVPGNAEFNARGVDKGNGLLPVMEKLGIDKEHVIAIGDSDNDLEMLQMAGISVAMGNAAAHIKETAVYVTGDNDHDGAAVFLEKFFCFDK